MAEEPQPAEPQQVELVLDYGTPADDGLTRVLRGVGRLLLVVGITVGVFSLIVGCVTLLPANRPTFRLRGETYFVWLALRALVTGLTYALYAAGGLLILRRHSAAVFLIRGGAVVGLAALVAGPFVESFVDGLMFQSGPNFGRVAFQVLSNVPIALVHLLLLYLFSRRLIRDTIRVK